MVNIKKGGLKGERVRPQSIRPLIKFPRGINSDQVISSPDSREVVDSVHLVRASSYKQQASSTKLLKQQATSVKPQAQRLKLQATSFKRQDS